MFNPPANAASPNNGLGVGQMAVVFLRQSGRNPVYRQAHIATLTLLASGRKSDFLGFEG
jgi:hypothetical protein